MRTLALVLFCATLFGVASVEAQGKFSGYMFGDYFYNVARDSAYRTANLPNSAVNGQKDLQAFQFRRIYFTYDNDIAENFTSRFRLEADQNLASGTGDQLVSGKIGVFVKDAYLTWKGIFAGSNLTFGIQPTPAYDISETAWGYRSLEKTIMDLRGIVPSRALGLALKGKFDEGGVFNYWVMVSNNNSGNSPNGTTTSTDRYKRIYGLIQIKPMKNLQVTVYGDFLPRPEINDPASTTAPPATVSNSVMTGAAFVGYSEPDKFNLGAEGFLQSASNGMADPGNPLTRTSLSALGLSFWGSVNVSADLAVVARFDIFDPNTNSSVTGDARNYIIGGLSWKPNKNVSIIPNVQIETYQSLPNGGRSIDPSVTGRVTFFYVFL